jgi:glycosyltransferase involved in cell wall biosynthesis
MILVLIADARSIHTQRWALHFAQKGHEVHLITYDPSGVVIPGVTEHVITLRWSNLYLSFIPRHFATQKLVRQINPDLIHAHFIAKYGFHLPGLFHGPTVVSAWGDDILILPPKSRLIHHYTKKVLDSVDLVYAVSHNIRDHILADFRIPPEHVHYLPFGIDKDTFSPGSGTKEHAAETVRIFSNRGFFAVYDTETLVRGFLQARASDSRLHLVLKGDGPQESAIRQLVGSLGLRDHVTFQQKTSYAEVPRDYRAADIFLTTSVSDGTPVSLLEAMASGLPCIATSVGGIPEWITDAENGILIPPRSPEAVADAILHLSKDPDLRSRLGTAARATILARGEWDILMAQVEKDYEELVNTYRKKRT